MLNGRGMMGDGVIAIKRLREAVTEAGYSGPIEVEIFNEELWRLPGNELLRPRQGSVPRGGLIQLMQPIGASRSKKELVIENLRNAILNRELIPGTRLVIEDLAKQLGVSPIPVREALQQLDADGYVVIEPYLGAKVAPIESESVIEVFSLLETMEVVSGRAACQHMSDAEFDILEAILLKERIRCSTSRNSGHGRIDIFIVSSVINQAPGWLAR